MALTVYLVDEPNLDIAVACASADKEGHVVMIQDAVYAALSEWKGPAAYVLKADVARRGLEGRVSSSVKVIDFQELVKMMEGEKVVNFL